MRVNWLSNFDDKERRIILVWVAAMCWAIWRRHSDIIFFWQNQIFIICAGYFQGTYWLRMWAHLQHEDMTKVLFQRASLALEAVALEIANHERKHNLSIGLDHFFFVHSSFSQWTSMFCRNQRRYTFYRGRTRFYYLKKLMLGKASFSICVSIKKSNFYILWKLRKKITL